MANKYDKVLGEYREADTTTETDPLSLHLDQTEPQYILNGSPVNLAEPEFTYTTGVLTRIDYPSGYYKAFTYNVDGTLASIDYNGEHTKTFTYASEILQSIATS
jgi:hypothetical protein